MAFLIAGSSEDVDQCAVLFRKALELDPNSAEGWRRLRFLHVQRAEPAEAIEAFGRTAAGRPVLEAERLAVRPAFDCSG